MLRSQTHYYDTIERDAKRTKNFCPERVIHTVQEGSRRNPIPEIRCFRCGESFPVTDFLSTKKSGLCTTCWERKIPGC